MIALPPDDVVDGWKARSRPLEEAELALVRSVVGQPPWLAERAEHAFRYALNLARLTAIRLPDGTDLEVAGFLAAYRDEVQPVATSLLSEAAALDPAAVIGLVPWFESRARAWRLKLLVPMLAPWGRSLNFTLFLVSRASRASSRFVMQAR